MADKRIILISFISRHYNIEELKLLCLRLGVDYEEIGEGGKSEQVRKLLDWTIRIEKVHLLVAILQEDRKDSLISEGLDLNTEYVNAVYEGFVSLPKNHPHYLLKLNSIVSQTDAEHKIRSLFWKMLWIRQKVLKQVDIHQNLKLRYWPVFIYQAECLVEYRFQQHKENRLLMDAKTLQAQSEVIRHPPQMKSKQLHVSIVRSAIFRPTSPDILDPNLINVLSQIVKGNKPRLGFSNSFINALVALIHKTHWVLLPYVGKNLWVMLDTGIYHNSPLIWPKLNSSKKFLSSLNPFLPPTDADDLNEHEYLVLDAREELKANIHSAFLRVNHAEPTNISFWNARFISVVLPFWVLDTEIGDSPLTIIINGWNGRLSYLYSPFLIT